RIGVHDHAAAEHVGRGAIAQGRAGQPGVDHGHAGGVGDDVVGVADVVLVGVHAPVRSAGRIEVAAGAGAVGGAAVAGLVHVEAVLAARRQAVDLAGDR